MLDFLGRISTYWAGLSSLHLLLFVLVIWVVFALILLADARKQAQSMVLHWRHGVQRRRIQRISVLRHRPVAHRLRRMDSFRRSTAVFHSERRVLSG